MQKLWTQTQLFLGPERLRVLAALFIITGVLSAILGIVQAEWVIPAQTLLILIFLVGTAVIIIGRMEGDARYRWGATIGPAIIALAIGLLIVPQYLSIALGAAAGWIIAGTFIFGRSSAPIQYKDAVKAMRKQDYAAAVKSMNEMVKLEPKEPNHYRFRAELYRLWGKLDNADDDYHKITQLALDADLKEMFAVGMNGIAEVAVQRGTYSAALAPAQKAVEMAPTQWVAAYNLGMIQDRLKDNAGVIDSLHKALAIKVPDVRHRLLTYLYLARAYSRLGDMTQAEAMVKELRRQRTGLEEWEVILKSDQASVLRDVMESDIQTARKLYDNTMTLEDLSKMPAPPDKKVKQR
jgi:tetratricopeptide (TPR) repeat protein